MNKTLMLKWAKALRSGKYKQGKYALKNMDNTFCCLGVLCDISGKGEWTPDGAGEYKYSLPGDGAVACLTDSQLLELGLDREEESELIELNDTKRATFEEIADVVDLLRMSQ